MLKLGGAAILMKENNIKYLLGEPLKEVKPLPPYDEQVCEFLADLSKRLLKDKKVTQYPDVVSFAFFCRKANIYKLKKKFEDGKTRIGRGVVFHIAPSNVPVNCLFTYVFGLISGNANIVRVSSKNFVQVEIVCDILSKMFEEEKYEKIYRMTAFVSYEKSTEVNDMFSSLADVRVIWGGDTTISNIRRSPLPSRATEITFADRYSLGIINPRRILEASESEITRLAEHFYNDTYLMDQNACSTPHLLCWISDEPSCVRSGKERFWQAVYNVAKKYNLEDIKVSDKYTLLCKYAIDLKGIKSIQKYENLLYVVTLMQLPEDISLLRGKFGLFFQYDITSLDEFSNYITKKVQTCVYYGINPFELRNIITQKSLQGIDRIVPIGSSLDIGVIWDGYDIVEHLSRVISIMS